MIQFLRKIRYDLMKSGETPEYLKYAIGEIILVVIGILIALQINNWNENRKQTKAEKLVLTNIYEDLATDSIQFAYYLKQYNQIEELHLELYRIGIKNEAISLTAEPSLIRRTLYFKQLIDKDFILRANELKNENIRKNLVQYTRFMADLESVYTTEVRPLVSDKLKPYLAEHQLYNTKNWFELKKRTFEDYDFEGVDGKNLLDKEGLIELSKTKEFQQMLLELNVKWNDFYSRLSTSIKNNSRLRRLLEDELKYYE